MARIVSIEIYADASGAPSVISHNGHTYAFDMLGELKINVLRRVPGDRQASKFAIAACKREYMSALASHVDAAWFARNQEMYSHKGA